MTQFSHLHLHTQYSLLDGANKVSEVIKTAHKMGQPAIAMTDHGNMHGAIEFYSTACKTGIKPIIGCELYVTPGKRQEKSLQSKGGKASYHLTALAANITGYRNLCKLVSLAYKEGFYFKPRVDHEILERFNEGLIILSGCLGAELAQAIMLGREEEARNTVEFYEKTFQGRYYLEVQPHLIKEQQSHNRELISFSKSMGIPLVATTDCHYGSADDHYAQEVLMCISTGKTVNDPDRIKHEGVHLHLKSYDEMIQEFQQQTDMSLSLIEESLRNTLDITSQCDLSFDFNTYYMPRFSEASEDELADEMAQLARQGLEGRISALKAQGRWDESQREEYQEQLERELALIRSMGFSSYFLVVSDFIVWSKEHDIPVGPGRGSCAGSLVAWAMRITEVDSIEHGLLFERFLNPERISLPDIDVDFCIHGRERVINYVVEKYGEEKVAQIATFGTLKAKAAIKDVGRALGLTYAETDKVAQLIPAPRQGFDYSIKDALEMEPQLKAYAESEGHELITLAMKIEGLTRHTSTHAAGLVIGDRPLMELLPMMVDRDGNDVTQYSMNDVEKIGLVKFDFLGLKTLTVIQTALKIVEESEGKKIDILGIPYDDKKTFSMLCKGDTIGVFQLESGGITEMTMRLKPSCFDDLVATIALYRPGPLDAGMVDHYIERKHKREPVTFLHPLMEPVLRNTYGIMLYQEQIMQLARTLAGYSLAEADFLRKAMGKKIPEEMAKQKVRFIEGTDNAGIDRALAEEIFGQMETFARYGFNKSHSVAYAMISYQTAYMKAHHKVAFMASLMSHDRGDSDKVLKNLTECRRQKIAILPPDLNESSADFTVSGKKIRFGLEAVKGVGDKAVSEIVRSRKEGVYATAEDFFMRVDPKTLNRKVIESLVKCGAFDFDARPRRELIELTEDMLKSAQYYHKEKASQQIGLFNEGGDPPPLKFRNLNLREWSKKERLSKEREALGFYISGHPVQKFRKELHRINARTTLELRAMPPGKHSVQTGGVVTALKLKNTKKGDRYASFILEDELGTIEALVWPDTYRKISLLLESEDPFFFKGRADITEERCNLIVDSMELISSIQQSRSSVCTLTLDGEKTSEKELIRLKEILSAYPGACRVKARYTLNGTTVEIPIPLKVEASEALSEEIDSLYGTQVVMFE